MAATENDRPSVLFVCVHNAGRSQMAAAYLQELSGGKVSVLSAGSEPGDRLNPAAVAVMAEEGIDLTQASPKVLTTEAVQASDVVITMGCGDTCPVFPGKRYEDWQLEDPAGKDIETVRRIRDDIKGRVASLLADVTGGEVGPPGVDGCGMPVWRVDAAGLARAAYTAALLSQGVPVEDIARDDPGREFIRPILEAQDVLANTPEPSLFAYGVINGTPVPTRLVEVLGLVRESGQVRVRRVAFATAREGDDPVRGEVPGHLLPARELAQQFGVDEGVELEMAQLQQPDRLHELRRQRQRLRLPELEPRRQAHRLLHYHASRRPDHAAIWCGEQVLCQLPANCRTRPASHRKGVTQIDPAGLGIGGNGLRPALDHHPAVMDEIGPVNE